MRRSPPVFLAAEFCGSCVFGSNQSQMGCGPKPPGCGMALGKKKLVSKYPKRDNDLGLPTYSEHPALNTAAIILAEELR